MTRQEIFNALSLLGAAKAVVSFSGGGDEGSVESIALIGPDGKKIKTLKEAYLPHTWDPATRTWKQEREYTEEEALVNALCDPVDERYGSFAGDFYVSGECVWDVASRKVRMSGEEKVMSPFEEDA
jgi:hypothetical protein